MMVQSWWCSCRVVVTLVVWAATIAILSSTTPAVVAALGTTGGGGTTEGGGGGSGEGEGGGGGDGGGGGGSGVRHPSSSKSPPSPSVVQQVEKSLLAMFGMTQRPRVKRGAVPPYMMELYQRQAGLVSSSLTVQNLQTTTTTTTTMAPPIPSQAHNTNTVRSFAHKESPGDKHYPNHKMRYRFNVTNIPEDEILHLAELRLSHIRHPLAPELDPAQEKKVKEELLHQNRPHRRKKWSSKDVPFLQRILVYDVLRPATQTSEPALRLLDTQMIDARTEGTQILDVSDALRRWISKPKANHGLLVEVLPLRQNNSTVDASHIHLRKSPDDTQWHERQPLLVTHSNDGGAKSRSKRNAVNKHKKTKNYCKRYPLYVDFRKVGWDDWIVAPAGYEAFFCKGDCPFPLADEMNTTNHAVVQTLVNSRYPDRVPKACCVPTELSAISMLYMDHDERFVLKNHQDMVVEGCGCR